MILLFKFVYYCLLFLCVRVCVQADTKAIGDHQYINKKKKRKKKWKPTDGDISK